VSKDGVMCETDGPLCYNTYACSHDFDDFTSYDIILSLHSYFVGLCVAEVITLCEW